MLDTLHLEGIPFLPNNGLTGDNVNSCIPSCVKCSNFGRSPKKSEIKKEDNSSFTIWDFKLAKIFLQNIDIKEIGEMVVGQFVIKLPEIPSIYSAISTPLFPILAFDKSFKLVIYLLRWSITYRSMSGYKYLLTNVVPAT